MTSNSATKRAARAYAAEHSVSYTAALRAVETARSTNARMAFLDEIYSPPTPAAPIPNARWQVRFKARDDLSLPHPLDVLPGGVVVGQEFWRGERLQIIGFNSTPVAGQMTTHWTEIEALDEPSDTVAGLYPVFAEADGSWATWNFAVASIETVDRPSADGKYPVEATFVGAGPAESVVGKAPHFNVRVEDLLPALSDETLKACWFGDGDEGESWILGSDASGWLWRALTARRDPNVLAASNWVERCYEAGDGAWSAGLVDSDEEPFRFMLDEEQAVEWLTHTVLHPSHQ